MNIWTRSRFNKNYISRDLSTIVTTVTMNVIRVLQLKILPNIPGIFVLPLTWCQRQLFCLSLLWAFLRERALNPYVDVHGGPFYEQFFFRSRATPDILGFSYQSFWERYTFDGSLFFLQRNPDNASLSFWSKIFTSCSFIYVKHCSLSIFST